MIRLYQGSGSSEIELLHPRLDEQQWAKLNLGIQGLLTARKQAMAASMLKKVPFVLWDGTNPFGDEFTVLYAKVDLDLYTYVAERAEQAAARAAATHLAHTASEVASCYVRFVAVALDTEHGPEPIAPPSLLVSSASVQRALADATHLIRSSGPVSAVDRVHTAMHGYLRAACERSGLEYSTDATVAALFKLIRQQHPAFSEEAPRSQDIRKIANSFGAILDALSPLRNDASIAHPNPDLLGEAEAMLVVNTVQTLLHYLDAKLG